MGDRGPDSVHRQLDGQFDVADSGLDDATLREWQAAFDAADGTDDAPGADSPPRR